MRTPRHSYSRDYSKPQLSVYFLLSWCLFKRHLASRKYLFLVAGWDSHQRGASTGPAAVLIATDLDMLLHTKLRIHDPHNNGVYIKMWCAVLLAAGTGHQADIAISAVWTLGLMMAGAGI